MAIYSLDEISSLLYDKALMWAKAKVHVYSDSVLCQGMMHGHSEAKDKWKDQLQYSQELVILCLFVCWIVGSLDSHWRVIRFQGCVSAHHLISNGHWEICVIDGEPLEFEWNIFPGLTTLQILKEVQDRMAVRQTSPEEFEDRIVFMSMFNDIDWTKKGNYNECFSNSEKVSDFAKRFPLGHWSFLCRGDEENVMESAIVTPKDKGILLQMSWLPISKTADIQFSELPARWIGDSWKRWTMYTSFQRWTFERRAFLFRTVDQWTHQNRSSSSSKNHMLYWPILNWDTSSVNIKRRIKCLDLSYPDSQVAPWMTLGMNEMTLPKTVRWWVLQALRDHTWPHHALRKVMRRRPRHNRVWWITYLKSSSRSTEENGMTFLPTVLSRKSRNLWQI